MKPSPHYVIIRDDDTNALTPPNYLEWLYRPFLQREMPVNLALIPCVRTTAMRLDGGPEGFLMQTPPGQTRFAAVQRDSPLAMYLRKNPGFEIAQHGYHHDPAEFDCADNIHELRRRFTQGTRLLIDAGFPAPAAFVAPHDKFSSIALDEAARRFPVVSTGWFEWQRLPLAWWGAYVWKKIRHAAHWRVNNTVLLSHPGCLLSRYRPYEGILPAIQNVVRSQRVTVLVTHWWEYFPEGRPDERFIDVLHRTASWLAQQRDVQVISFGRLAQTGLPQ